MIGSASATMPQNTDHPAAANVSIVAITTSTNGATAIMNSTTGSVNKDVHYAEINNSNG